MSLLCSYEIRLVQELSLSNNYTRLFCRYLPMLKQPRMELTYICSKPVSSRKIAEQMRIHFKLAVSSTFAVAWTAHYCNVPKCRKPPRAIE